MKKLNTLLNLILILTLLTYFSCEKEVLKLDNIENDEITDVLSFKKNGNIWKPKKQWNLYDQRPALSYDFDFNDSISLSDNFNMYANRIIQNDSSVYTVFDQFSLKTNVLDTGFFTITKAGITGPTDNNDCSTHTHHMIFDSANNNYIRITEIDTLKNAAAGYFEFTTIDTLCNDTVSYTEGRFRLGFNN